MTDAETYGYKPYPSYKISGASWLGEIPEHWEARQIRTVARVMNGATPSTSVPEYWDGDVVWITPDDLGKSRGRFITGSERRITQAGYEACGTNLAPPGSIVLSTRAPIGHIGVLRSPACTNQGCRLLSVKGNFQSTFAFYQLTAARPELESLGQGTTFTELSKGTLAAFPVALPPVDEQATIVRYLDDADQRIRAYVSAKERLIALLEEERQAVIHQAVTRGLDPNVKLKPSGVEWLGDVPEHWQRQRIKNILQPIDQKSSTGFETLLSLRRDHGIVVYDEHFSRPSQSESLVGYKLVNEDQLVVNRLQANNGLIFNSTLTGLVSPDYSVFQKKCPTEMRLLSELLRTHTYRTHFRQNATGLGTGTAGFLRLYDDTFLETPVFLPSMDEQTALVEYLDLTKATFSNASKRVRRQIELIEEYRTRLIADVVTGKIDVREAKP